MAKKSRSIKVYRQSGSNYKTVPAIVLKGQWLQELGFEIGDFISIKCENGKLVITPDAERMALIRAGSLWRMRWTAWPVIWSSARR
jgi:antitoxin component of MazEF toxin-antitoxin module